MPRSPAFSQASAAAVSVGLEGGPGRKTEAPVVSGGWAGSPDDSQIATRPGPALGRRSGLPEALLPPPSRRGWLGRLVCPAPLSPVSPVGTAPKIQDPKIKAGSDPGAPSLLHHRLSAAGLFPHSHPTPLTLDQRDRLWSGDICCWTCGMLQTCSAGHGLWSTEVPGRVGLCQLQ